MHYLWIKFVTNGSNRLAADINFGQEGISRVSIHSWGATGLQAAALPAIIVKVMNQPAGGLYGNGGSVGFPLMVPSTPNAAVYLDRPIMICEGDNIWNNSHRLELELYDYNGNPLVFTDFTILFELLVRDPFFTREQPPHDFQHRKESVEPSTRNVAHLPNIFYF